MPAVPSISPATGQPTSSSYIHTTDCNFVDNAGRTLLLRGVNLSGSAKAPVGKPSYIQEGFWDEAENGGESFDGRPLNIDDGTADVHLARLRGWGFNMLRFPITWEALEHEGPGKYDYDFMDYTVRVLRKCKEYGFKVYMDPHQDIWARFSGGSGAPYWTLPAIGVDPRNLTATQSAIVHCEYPTPEEADPASLPAMIWSTNYGRLLSQTVFTLFFAGRDFAPKCIIDGKNIQDWLQEHYIEAMGKMADRIQAAGDLLEECVIGWDSMNEPFEGLCSWKDLNVSPTAQGSTLRKGTHPSPAQSFRLGMGQAQTVENFKFGTFGPQRDGSVTIDPKGVKVWSAPSTERPDGVHPKWGWKRDPGWTLGICPWALHGVWDVETGYVNRPDYFRFLPPTHLLSPRLDEPEVEFIQDYWRPHFIAFTERIRASHPEAIMFVQPPVFSMPPTISEDVLKGRGAYSGHYYDGLTLVTRHWNWFNADALGLLRGKYYSPLQAVKIGEWAIRKSLQEQLGVLKTDAEIIGPYPTIIGEIGIPYDMDDKRAYGWTDGGKYAGDFSRHEKALDASLNATDGPNAINFTIWTYCADNCHDWGDGWNMEDLSLWSEDDLRWKRKNQRHSDDSATLFGQGDDSSKAGLLKPTQIPSRTPSAVSLGTMMSAQQFESDLVRWKENPYEFLTDGARAVKAFSRPFPAKVVGKSSDIQFDISKAQFKLVVTVRPEDRLKAGTSSEEETATEIYVPLVHYAHSRLLPSTPSADGAANASGSVSKNASTMDLQQSLSQSSTSTTVTAPSVYEKDMLDLEVEVSAGRWSVDGQLLKWWYDVPEAGSAPVEYTIQIRRRGGMIVNAAHATTSEPCGGWNWMQQVCFGSGEGCVVM